MDEDIKGGEQREVIGFPGLLLIILLVHYKEDRVLLKMGGGMASAPDWLIPQIFIKTSRFFGKNFRFQILRFSNWFTKNSVGIFM